MSKYLSLLLVLLFSVSIYAQETSYEQGGLRVKLTEEAAAKIEKNGTKRNKRGEISTGIKAVDDVNKLHKATEFKRVFPFSPTFEDRHRKHGLHLWYDVVVDETTDIPNAIKQYMSTDAVTKAEPHYKTKLILPGNAKKVDAPKKRGEGDMPFDDPYLPEQWHYDNTGQSGGTVGEDINLFDAWKLNAGLPNVIVSIHDEGVDVNHEDLAANIWVNEAELNGIPNFDDDGNGYKDDIHGFNFADNMGDIPGEMHGSHVAGTIAAVNNNGIGVSGVAGGTGIGDGARIMSCRILGGRSAGNTPASYVYAADMGAVISQNSWGYMTPGVYSQATLDAIDYFVAEAGNYPGSPMKGGIVICAAGNDGRDDLHYPGAYESCIAVVALDAMGGKTGYSTMGTWADISAPGGESADDFVIGDDNSYSNGIMSTMQNNSYGVLDGTSMACPHVSGVAALVVSKFGNSSFTVEDLKKHLLTGVRENILYYEANLEFAGKMGSGYCDAVLALAEDHQIPPNRINSLLISGISQDFALLEWQTPEDGDDGKPFRFEVLVSTDTITKQSHKTAKSTIIRNTQQAGENMTYEVGGLQSLTKYYFAVNGIDRWGNTSQLSNVIVETTNAGPLGKISDGYNAMSLHIDVSVDTIGIYSFEIENNGEGILRWEAIQRHKESEAYSVNPSIKYPALSSLSLSAREGINAIQQANSSMTAYNIEFDNNDEYLYLLDYNSFWTIGETDTAFTNSAASRYLVEEENGFNLTQVDVSINYNPKTGPIVLEIYSGYDIRDAKLLLAQEINDIEAWEYGLEWEHIKLDEQIFLEKGTHFWVAYHVPSGNLFPIVAGIEAEPETSENCYISQDLGKSWDRIEDAYFDNQIVWAIVPMSTYEPLGDYVAITPNNGQVVSMDKTMAVATINAKNMVNGNYKGNIVIYTNEPDKPMLRLPLDISITGQIPELTLPNRVDFTSVLQGSTKTVEVIVQNFSLSRFDFTENSCEISNSDFELVNNFKEPLDAGYQYTVKFRFTPSTTGNAMARVKLLDKNGFEHHFELFGVGVSPPIAVMTEHEETYTNLTIGDEVQGSFSITNDGKYPLDYFVPMFANSDNMAEIPADIHKFGYTVELDNEGNTYVWDDIVQTGTNITDKFFGDWHRGLYHQVDLGFEFPFFGINESQVYISKYGTLSFDIDGALWSRIPLAFKYGYNINRFISAWGLHIDIAQAGYGNIYYQRFADKFIVQFEDVPIEDGWRGRMTFQMVLHDNGNINMYYKNVEAREWELDIYPMEQYWTFVAIEDQNQDDGLLAANREHMDFEFNDGSAILFTNPGTGAYTSMSNSYGTIFPDETIQLDYTIATSSLNVSNYTESIVVITNDPVNNPLIHSAHLEIGAGGTPEVAILTTNIDFAEVFKDDIKLIETYFTNTGRASDRIVAVNFDNDYYTLIGNVPEIIKPGRKVYYKVSIITDAMGDKTDVMHIMLESGAEITVNLSGTIIAGPKIELSLPSINTFINSGQKRVVPLTISNPGDYPLDVAPVGNGWMTFAKTEVKEGKRATTVPNLTYNVTRSNEEDGPTYNWVDLTEEGVEIESLNQERHQNYGFSNPIPMLFTFNFYDEQYDTIYAGYNGIMTFLKDQTISIFGGGVIPNPDSPNGFIAPCYLGGGQDWAEIFPKVGVYVLSEEDKMTIEYHDYNSGFGMGFPISFQAIIYKNGNIKFQYQMPAQGENRVTEMGVIGVENHDGSDGVMVAYYDRAINEDMSILLTPVNKYVIPQGESMDFDITLDATILYAGSYNHNFPIINNAPEGVELKLPVNLYVSGSPEIVIPDEVVFGDLIVEEVEIEDETEFVSHIKEFEISNTGTDKFYIMDLAQNNSTDVIIEVYSPSTNMNGDTYWNWNKIQQADLPFSIMPEKEIQFKVSLTPEQQADLNDELSVNTDLGNYTIPVIANAYLPPVIDIDVDSVKVFAYENNHTETKSFTIGNQSGGYSLTYDLELVFDRLESDEPEIETLNNDENAIPANLFAVKCNPTESKANKRDDISFNRTLAHDEEESAESNLGYGGGASFHTLTQFKAPADGFNLTHVQTWYAPNDWKNSEIKIAIYGGNSSINNAKLIHTQEYQYNIEEDDIEGKLLTIELTDSVLFYPNEYFFVEFAYDAGAAYPQGIVPIINNKEGVFQYSDGTQWNDIIGSGFDDFGWMVRACEASFEESAWITITSELNGTLAPGESTEISMDFASKYGNQGDNIANLIIRSNDPYSTENNVVVLLRNNKGPEYQMEENEYVIIENETLEFQVKIKDYEGDDYTITVNELSFTTSIFNDGILDVSCTPGYSDNGSHELLINGEDALGNKTQDKVYITVIDVNRPTRVRDDVTEKFYASLDTDYTLPVYDLFEDPDNDKLTVIVEDSNEGIIDIAVSSSRLIIMPLTHGTTTLKVTATDGKSDPVTVEFNVATGVTSVFENENLKFSAYPNPVQNLLNVSIPVSNSNQLTAQIINITGTIVYETIINHTDNKDFTINTSNLHQGMYFLRIKGEESTGIVKIIKQ